MGSAVWRGALVSSAAALAVSRAGPSSSHCHGPVDYLQQAFSAVWQLGFGCLEREVGWFDKWFVVVDVGSVGSINSE